MNNLPDELINFLNNNFVINNIKAHKMQKSSDGTIKNAIEFMNNMDIMLVPLFSAGGIRVKIIEGMALSKPIISTSIGAEGIEVREYLQAT